MQTEISKENFIGALIGRARGAMHQIGDYTQRQVDELAAAIVYATSREEVAMEIAKLALEETKMGHLESKCGKLTKKMPAVFYDIKNQKTVGIVEEIKERNLIKIAKPVGVIGALIPSTNPEGTPVFNALNAIRGRNAVVFAPHPRSKRTSYRVTEIMRGILELNGAPADLLQCIEFPSKELSNELMRQCDLIMATGSSDMVRAAYSAGKPAYGVGAGNAVIVVDETADINDAANKIRLGKTGDFASGCSAENSLVIQSEIYTKMVEALIREGGYLASAEEKERLQNVMWVDGHLTKDIIAQPVEIIADLADIELPEGVRFIMVEETGAGPGFPFSGEKLSLVMTLYRYSDFEDAVCLVNTMTRYSGYGHSCGIHSDNEDHIRALALGTSTTRVLVRQPHGVGNGGNWCNGLPPTFSLGCGTWGGNIVSENVSQKHFINTTWLSYPIDREVPSDEEIYGDLLQNVKWR